MPSEVEASEQVHGLRSLDSLRSLGMTVLTDFGTHLTEHVPKIHLLLVHTVDSFDGIDSGACPIRR